MHTWFSQRSQLFQDYDYPIFLAEVASTFNEELLTHHLLETNDRSEDARLHHQSPDRRHSRHAFPADDVRRVRENHSRDRGKRRGAHARRFQSGISQAARGLLRRRTSCSIRELDLECLRIPHFYSAFYVYKYATGISAAVALSEQVFSRRQRAVEAYLGFLKSGGSKFPLETLQAAGVDMTTPAPVESTLRLFERRLTELEALLLG